MTQRWSVLKCRDQRLNSGQRSEAMAHSMAKKLFLFESDDVVNMIENSSQSLSSTRLWYQYKSF